MVSGSVRFGQYYCWLRTEFPFSAPRSSVGLAVRRSGAGDILTTVLDRPSYAPMGNAWFVHYVSPHKRSFARFLRIHLDERQTS